MCAEVLSYVHSEARLPIVLSSTLFCNVQSLLGSSSFSDCVRHSDAVEIQTRFSLLAVNDHMMSWLEGTMGVSRLEATSLPLESMDLSYGCCW